MSKARELLQRLTDAALIVINNADDRGDTDLVDDSEEYTDWKTLRSVLGEVHDFIAESDEPKPTGAKLVAHIYDGVLQSIYAPEAMSGANVTVIDEDSDEDDADDYSARLKAATVGLIEIY